MKGAAILKAEGATTFRASGVLKKCLRPGLEETPWRPVAAGCLAESSNIWDLGTFAAAADWLALAEGGEMDDSIEPL